MAIMKTLNGNKVCDAVARGMEPVVTTGTDDAYNATVEGITALTSGISLIVVPHVTNTSTAPTFNVNDLGAEPIRQRISSSAGGTTALSSENMIMAGRPIKLMYIENGMGSGNHCWVIDDMVKPDVNYAIGILPVASGGTGATTASDARTNLEITLNNLGIAWGTATASSTGPANSIYIQIN